MATDSHPQIWRITKMKIGTRRCSGDQIEQVNDDRREDWDWIGTQFYVGLVI